MYNLLFISSSLGFGGASKVLCFIAEALAERDYRVHIVSLNNTRDVTSFRREISPKIRVHALPDVPDGIRRHWPVVKAIRKIAEEEKIDAILSFTTYPGMYAAIVGKLLHIPTIMSERGDPSKTNGKGLKSRLAVFLINRSTGGVFQIEGARAFYGRRLQKRSVVIPNPIFVSAPAEPLSQGEREKTVVSVGRLDNEQKRYDVMLEAFRLFHESHPEYTLKLYGRGNDEERIRRWAADLGIADCVRFPGLTQNAMSDIRRDGIFVITSDYEGISNALLEAMAVGLPCVSTDHTPGGARLLIQDRSNGLLAPIGDARAIAACLCAFADDPSLAERCANNARDVARRFAPDRIVDMWDQYIKDVIRRDRKK